MELLDIQDFLQKSEQLPVVDVRSPGEYHKGHITVAKNIPVFSDKERALVGTLYKHAGREKAIEEGLGIVGPKMQALALHAKKLAKNDNILVHCWRGGMRSEKMAWLFETAGLHCGVLKGGYKSYRLYMLDFFEKMNNLVVLHGATGSGKTDILHALARLGEQVIDLEGLANHRGSAFGAMGMDKQPTSSQFQNDIFHLAYHMDPDRPIWIEAESLTIGRAYLPEPFWLKINASPGFEIIPDKQMRIDRIVEEYGKFDLQLLEDNLLKIQKRFGNDRTKNTLQKIRANLLPEAVEDLLVYYDKAYALSMKEHQMSLQIKKVETGTMNAEEIARQLILALKAKNHNGK